MTATIIVGAFALLGTVFFFFVLRGMKNAPTYDTCPRCGWESNEEKIHKTDCDWCKNMTDEKAANLLKNTL